MSTTNICQIIEAAKNIPIEERASFVSRIVAMYYADLKEQLSKLTVKQEELQKHENDLLFALSAVKKIDDQELKRKLLQS